VVLVVSFSKLSTLVFRRKSINLAEVSIWTGSYSGAARYVLRRHWRQKLYSRLRSTRGALHHIVVARLELLVAPPLRFCPLRAGIGLLSASGGYPPGRQKASWYLSCPCWKPSARDRYCRIREPTYHRLARPLQWE